MNKGFYEIFGAHIKTHNKHWLESLGKLLIFMSVVNMDEAGIIFQEENENPLDEAILLDRCKNLFEQNNFNVDGYTFRVISEWFIDYSRQYFSMSIKNKIKQKEIEIKAAQAELDELKSSFIEPKKIKIEINYNK